MAEEDDVDIVGEFHDDMVQSGSAYPVDDMGLNINELLPLLGSHNWLLSTDQVWNLDNPVEDRSRFSMETCLTPESDIKPPTANSKVKTTNLVVASHKKPWTESEKNTFVRGLDIYGKSWSKISKFIGTRTTLQVKNFARQFMKHKDQQILTDLATPRGDIFRLVDQPSIDLAETSSEYQNESFIHSHTDKLDAANTGDVTSVSNDAETAKEQQRNNGEIQQASGEIVRINKENSDSELEDIDIENVEESSPRLVRCSQQEVGVVEENALEPIDDRVDSNSIQTSLPGLSTESIEAEPTVDNVVAPRADCPKHVSPCNGGLQEVETDGIIAARGAASGQDDVGTMECRQFHLEVPQCERLVARDKISDEERQVHHEFFEGRPQKTPERYLRIRNHILDAWDLSKRSPRGDGYLNKTSVRQGLRNCGDVNCIGRVHSYLEQTGAINFGSSHIVYVRPFSLTQSSATSAAKRTLGSGQLETWTEDSFPSSLRKELWRSRKRKVPVLRYDSEAGGFTMEHGEDGEVIDVARGVEAAPPPSVSTKRARRPENPFRLIKCAEYTRDRPAPFTVTVCLDALLVMDTHAHLSPSLEVIGLLGGHFFSDTAELHILSAEPCKSLSTGSECEMDPVSQTLASDRLHDAGQSVIGWYHSHPSFEPNPSVRDIETQTKFQEWFGAGGAPFLGVIVSPDLPSLPCAKIRYLVVGDVEKADGEFSEPGESFRPPYRIPSVPAPFEGHVSELVSRAADVIQMSTSIVSKTPLNMLNKLLSSIHHHASQALVDRVSATTLMDEIGQILIAALAAKEPDT